MPKTATLEVTLLQSLEVKQISDNPIIRHDSHETTEGTEETTEGTTEIPVETTRRLTTRMSTRMTTEKLELYNETEGVPVSAADDLPPKKKRCSLLQDASEWIAT